MKRLVTVIAALSLTAALLAGCGSSASTSAKLKDGTWKADAGQFDAHGWKPTIEVTVKDGKITNAVYDEFNKDDNRKKSGDAAYLKSYKEANPDADPKATYEKLGKSLVEKQDVSKVDTVAGATASTKSFKDMATKALGQAK